MKIVGADNAEVLSYRQETPFIVEEKVDGSQIRGSITKDGVITVGSKNVDFTAGKVVPKGFAKGVEQMQRALTVFKYTNAEVVLFGEYLEKPLHNALQYDRVPTGNIYLFDAKVNGKWVTGDDLVFLAEAIGFEPVNVLASYDLLPTFKELKEYLGTTSVLGGQQIEGIVLKNRGVMIDQYGKPAFYAFKLVRKEFKELNSEVWKTQRRDGIHSINELIAASLEALNTKNIWNKAIQHIRDDGKAQHSMRDMQILSEYIDADIDLEYREPIEEFMFTFLRGQIKRYIMKGLPGYYKQLLYEMQQTGDFGE